VLSVKQATQFRKVLESRIAEAERILSSAQQEAQDYAIRQADEVDQAANEYARQAAAYKAIAARQTLKMLREALKWLDQGIYGECSDCGGEIERKRLEAIPWARYCLTCQEARERSKG
jgi:DnaK suppressor protein